MHLDPDGREPLRHQLAAELRSAIRAGRLRAGVRLPASRALATQLGVSRGVVTDAYEQLTAEGFLASRQGAGTTVAGVTAGAAPPGGPAPAPAARPRFDFTPTSPDVSLFPRTLWAKALTRAAGTAPDAALDYQDGRGRAELREALAGHLGRVRGTACEPDDIVVCAGYHQATVLLCELLAARGARRIAFEDPSLRDHWRVAVRAGLEPVPVALDGDGLRADALEGTGADAVVITPSHQFPTGAVMGAERRHELLAWARRGRRLIVEDDYDAEFRYDRRPLGALQGLDPSYVAYVGTASKTLAPMLRLGWVIAPRALAPALGEIKDAADQGSPALDQIALADLLASGAHERHLRSVRRAYAERRALLVGELGAAVAGATIEGAAAGVHLVLALPAPLDAARLASATAAHGVAAASVESYARRPPGTAQRLVLGYGRIPTPSVRPAVAALAAALRDAAA
ncbi:MAG TPA: PLP-dependent aminotransferase family protein [Solirubrobacteraceae bacterium]|nr:PLP-dependent aminotransferase family protein [Solirubrobacteraceae bacterium]